MSHNITSRIDSYLSDNFDKIQNIRNNSPKSIRWDDIANDLGLSGRGERIRKRFFTLRKRRERFPSNDIIIKSENNKVMSFNYNTMEIDVEEELSNLDRIINKLASKGVHVNLDLNGGRDKHISRALMPYVGGDLGNVLIISDLHSPYDLDGYLSFCRDQQEKFNCGTVIYIGDIVDFHSISYHEKQPEELNPTGEIALARLRLSDWYRTFPEATVIMGNHDLLIYRQARTAGLLREFIQDPNTIFQAPSTYTFMDELIIGDVIYTHGSTSNAFKKCVLENMNMVSGHAHTQCGIVYHQNRHGKKWGMQVGVGIDYASHAFDYAKVNSKYPVTACGVVLNNGSLPIIIPYDETSY